MAIDSITGRKPDLPTIKTPPKNGPDSSKQLTNNGVQSDTVAITSAAQEIKKTFESPQGATVDVDHVASVKKAIADGSYSIDANKIAHKMIQFEKSLLGDGSS